MRHHVVATLAVPKVAVPVVVTAILHRLVKLPGVVAMEEEVMVVQVNGQHHLRHHMHRSNLGMVEVELHSRVLLTHPHHPDMVVAAAIVEAIIYAQGMNLVGMVRCSIQACKPLTFGAT